MSATPEATGNTTRTPIPVDSLLGSVADAPWADRRHDIVEIGWGDARKHRRLVRTTGGRELALRLPRGTFLADGAVLHDDGETAVVVRRPAEPAIVLSFADCAGPDDVRRALLLGYLLGNRHAPLEVGSSDLRTPLLTGVESATRTLAELGLPARVDRLPLAAHGWSMTSADHRDGHRHDPSRE